MTLRRGLNLLRYWSAMMSRFVLLHPVSYCLMPRHVTGNVTIMRNTVMSVPQYVVYEPIACSHTP